MQRIRRTRLFYQQGRSDKVYEVDLCELGEGQFVVPFRYGRRGATLREGTKTSKPVDRERAEKIFDRLIAAKRQKGYREAGEAPAEAEAPIPKIRPVDSPAAEDILLERLGRKPKRGEPSLERTIWRVGERRIRSAVPKLLELAEASSGQKKIDIDRRYAIAWTLGRLGDPRACPRLDALTEDTDPQVRRIAVHALWLCSDETKRGRWLDRGLNRLPEPLRDAVLANDTRSAIGALEAHLREPDGDTSVIELLYLLDAKSAARDALIHWLRRAPLAPPYFQRIRHIFKAAELRLDSQIAALIAHRFETTPPSAINDNYYDSGYVVIGGEWISLEQELKKPDARMAFASKTRNYLRRRYIRLLRRLGEPADPAFVEMAAATLLTFSDNDARQPYRRDTEDWETGIHRAVNYDRFSLFAVLNFLLYRHSPRYGPSPRTLVWRCLGQYRPGQPAPEVREEAFPRLWDSRPDLLVRLLCESRCAPVHQFAARALRRQETFIDQQDIEVIARWSAQPYEPTQALALASARRRWNPEEPDTALALMLLGASLDDARRQAHQWIEEGSELFLSRLDLLPKLALHPDEDTRRLIRRLLLEQRPPSPDDRAATASLMAELVALAGEEPASESTQARVRDGAETLLQCFADTLQGLGLPIVRDLLSHPSEDIQALGGRLVLNHEMPATELPGDFLEMLLDSPFEQVNGLGVQLLARQPIERLLENEQLLLASCLAPSPDLRSGSRDLLRRVASDAPPLAEAVIPPLCRRLMRAERHDGLYDDVIQMLTEDLAPSLSVIREPMTWRLLRNPRSAAQRFGHFLLSHRPIEFSTRQWALLAGHPMALVRAEAWDQLRQNLERTVDELDDALCALDTDWPDSRELGQDFFRRHIPGEAWTPERLVELCDSPREEVRRFGQDLIQEYFRSEHGGQYLLHLSQHPSPAMQLFATHFLERFAAGRVDRIVALAPYFRAVLGRVYRGRVAKDRILRFLAEQGQADPQIAAAILPILHHASATVARGDRSSVLLALRDLNLAHPDLTSPLEAQPIEVRGG